MKDPSRVAATPIRPARRAFTPVVDHVPLTVTIAPAERCGGRGSFAGQRPASRPLSPECLRTQNDPLGARPAATAPAADTAPNGGCVPGGPVRCRSRGVRAGAGRGCRVRGAGGRDNAGVARTSADAVRRIGIRLSALAQDGLTYAADDYDRDRYRQLSRLAAELLAALSGRPAGELAVELGRDSRLRHAEGRRARRDLRRFRSACC